MAKALFHKGQRVYVKSVGTWATIEQVVPHWVSNVEEPIRVHYEVGLGRVFGGHELVCPEQDRRSDDPDVENWRIMRLRAHWEFEGSNPNDPRSGTFPVVVTDERDWGGWRTPKAEYDRDPERIDFQARIIANAPALLRIVREFVKLADEGVAIPDELKPLLDRARDVRRRVYVSDDDVLGPIASEIAAE